MAYILMFPFDSAFAETISYSIKFDISKLSLTDTIISNQLYVIPQIDNCINSGQVGEPSLPVKTLVFSVPQRSTNYTIHTDIITKKKHSNKRAPFPFSAPGIFKRGGSE